MMKISMTEVIKKLKRKTKTKVHAFGMEVKTCEMYKCLRRILLLSRWFGFLPVVGLESPFYSAVRFNCRSLYSVYFLFTIFGQVTLALISFYGCMSTEFLTIPIVSRFIFYLTSTVTVFIMLIFAKNLPSLIKEIAKIENSLIRLPLDKNISTRATRLSFFIMLMGLVEHILCIIYVLNFVMRCLNDFTFSYPVLEMYFTIKMIYIPHDTPVSFWAGIFLELSNLQATFLWSFVDVLVMTVSMYLVSAFKEFSKLIDSEKNNLSADWGQLRQYHSQLVALVKKVDSRLDLFVLQSFFTNLFFTCLQLYNSLKITQFNNSECDPDGMYQALHGLQHSLYYSFSFVFLITRTFFVSILAADVNSYASKPISALGEIHASVYNVEIQRFYRQLTYTTIGLSGVFFYVTRRMILKVVGTLITYELVLLQFNYNTGGHSIMDNSTFIVQQRKITFNY